MKFFATTLLFVTCFTGFSLNAQSLFWQDADAGRTAGADEEAGLYIRQFRSVTIDEEALWGLLRLAPDEGESAGARQPLELTLPLPDGKTATFSVYRSPVMEPALAARYPQIQSFLAAGENGSGRFDLSPLGFSGVFQTNGGEVFIDPYPAGDPDRRHLVYYTRDVIMEESALPSLSCGYTAEEDTDLHEIAFPPAGGGRSTGIPVSLRTYTLALACTGEYAQTHGGTLESVMASFNSAVNRLNQTFEREVAVRILLMQNTDKLIWLDPTTDPYLDANQGRRLLEQNTNVIVNTGGFPLNSFDLGHVFTAGCTDVGGIAGGTVCSNGKARGVTCHSSPNVNVIVRRVMTHEVAHQFSASHTFSNCPNALDQLASGTAFEPGSGSTIMSYAGACGNQNIQFDNDDYYHVGSLEEFIGYSRQGFGGTCATEVPTENTEPEVMLPYRNGFFIPIGTPFELRAVATDAEDETLTYCWEQYNRGPLSNLGNPVGDAPSFRSYPPKDEPTRTFPRLETIINNGSDPREVLPDEDRALNFKVTVRDNHPGAGAAVWAEVAFRATATAGPFRVLAPNAGEETWTAGRYAKVEWEVANTDNELVNCRLVDIRLSVDGGFTYPIVLARQVPNNGQALVAVPEVPSETARVRVEAADNIFFDISDADFRILPADRPAFTLSPDLGFQKVCLPAEISFSVRSSAFQGFSNPITLELAGGIPANSAFRFEPASIMPGEQALLTLTIPDGIDQGPYVLLLRGLAEGADTTVLPLFLDLTSNDHSALALLSPADGEAGIILSMDFSWSASPNADAYEFELATSPAFVGASLLERATGLTETTYTPQKLFVENTLYYWRVRPVNECGPGAWLGPRTFHTESVDCTTSKALDLPVPIPGSGLPTKESRIFVETAGVISDVNIPRIEVSYQPVSSLRVSLVSPAGTTVVLYNRNCFNTIDLILGFDDQAPQAIQCPPDDGIVFQPAEPLSRFIGENTQGQWTLRVQVISGGFGAAGSIRDFQLQFCASVSALSPQLITNDTLFVPPGESNTITPGELSVQDADNGPDELRYTIVTPPAHGALYLAGEPLSVGDHFRQSTIDAFNLSYLHDGSDTRDDIFTFVVEDGTGGWIPTQAFHIKIDDNAVVGTRETGLPDEWTLFPNPTDGMINLHFGQALSAPAEVRLYNLQGRSLLRQPLPAGQIAATIDGSHLPGGLYLLTLAGTGGTDTRKVIIE